MTFIFPCISARQLPRRQGILRPDRPSLLKADPICKIQCSSYLIEHDMTHRYGGLLGDKQDLRVESGETVAARIRKYGWLASEQTIVTSSWGLTHLPRAVSLGKLIAMTEAKRILGG